MGKPTFSTGKKRRRLDLLDDSCVGLCYFNRKRETERAKRGLPPSDDAIAKKFRDLEKKKAEYRKQLAEDEAKEAEEAAEAEAEQEGEVGLVIREGGERERERERAQ